MSCFLCIMSFAQDWLSVINTGISLLGWGITLYIAISISRKLDSERTLKYHFIDEVKSVREHEEAIFQYIIANSIKPQQLKSMMGNLNTNVGDLMNLLKSQYGIDDSFLNAFQWKYSQLITDDEDFTSNYKDDLGFNFKPKLLKDFSNYRADKLKLFNDLIVEINNAKSKK
ncbi:MAG: hypothetical protein J6T22_11775 [Bacteroidales bacterium]|nr:hypothetical protein [Bacteroidales bacterium]